MSEPDHTEDKPLRLTKDVREALLHGNEGFTDSTYYSSPNFTEERKYKITDGELHVHSSSSTSWADSRRKDDFVVDEAATHRFLRERLHALNTEGVREAAAAIRAERATAPRPKRDAQQDAVDGDGASFLEQTDEGADVGAPASGFPVKTAAVAAAIGAAIWAVPRLKRAWRTTGNPKVAAWRARRSAKRHSKDGTASAELVTET
jgi:hypothetical protein